MTTPIRVAVLGLGRIGRRHARTVATRLPGAELTLVADTVEEVARDIAAELRVGRWTTDAMAAIADPDVDAILIASPTEQHAPQILAAAEAGKHIFCEKPIAIDLETTDRAIDAVERAGVRLHLGFNRRFDAGYLRAKADITAGRIGAVESIRDVMRDPAPAPRAYIAGAGGHFRDMTIHNFDCVRWLAGCEVVEVFAMAAALVDPMFAELGDVDTSIVTLRLENGALAVIDNSRRSGFGYDLRTEIFGSEGALFVGVQQATPVTYLSAAGVMTDHIHFFLDRFADAYVAEVRDFVEAIAEGRPTSVTGADGRSALALAYAAEASVREHAPVDVTRFARGGPG